MSDFDYRKHLTLEQKKFTNPWRLEHFTYRTLPLCSAWLAIGVVLVRDSRLRKSKYFYVPGTFLSLMGVWASTLQILGGEVYVRRKYLENYPEIWLKRREQMDAETERIQRLNMADELDTVRTKIEVSSSDADVNVTGRAKTYEQIKARTIKQQL